jgi:hypothetical protein
MVAFHQRISRESTVAGGSLFRNRIPEPCWKPETKICLLRRMDDVALERGRSFRGNSFPRPFLSRSPKAPGRKPVQLELIWLKPMANAEDGATLLLDHSTTARLTPGAGGSPRRRSPGPWRGNTICSSIRRSSTVRTLCWCGATSPQRRRGSDPASPDCASLRR